MAKQSADMNITHNDRIVHHEEDHAMFANIVDQRNSRGWQGKQDTRNAQKREGHNEQNVPERTYPKIGTHLIFAMKIDVGKDEADEKHKTDGKCTLLRESVEDMVPNLSHIKEERSAEDITQIEPQRIAVKEEPITNKREEQHYPMQVANPFNEVHKDVSHEERKQEPKRAVAEGQASNVPTEL